MKRPTVEEINEYMQEREFFVPEQADIFFDHFESKGWYVGKSKMKCWKAATRNWIRNAKKWSKNEKHQRSNQTHSQRQHEQAADAYKQMEFEHTESDAGTIRPLQ
tara:strand:- start:1464 stop:1778 length:315 start_codon:yes stop_codon:yes gene_type:complete